MASPKSKISRSRRGMRRSHWALKPEQSSLCTNCGSLHRPHHLCLSCGYYKGKQVVVAKLSEEAEA